MKYSVKLFHQSSIMAKLVILLAVAKCDHRLTKKRLIYLNQPISRSKNGNNHLIFFFFIHKNSDLFRGKRNSSQMQISDTFNIFLKSKYRNDVRKQTC